VILITLAGCGEDAVPDRPETVSVTGTVTYNGEPAPATASTQLWAAFMLSGTGR
jgi:hypothetical protein